MARKLSKKSVREIRARFQEKKPSPEQLVAAGDMEPPVSQATFLAAWQAVEALKKARLEAGLHLNPTLDTLGRYALALGRGLALSFPLLETVEKGDRKRVLIG